MNEEQPTLVESGEKLVESLVENAKNLASPIHYPNEITITKKRKGHHTFNKRLPVRAMNNKRKCLTPECTNFASVRGLCLSCYPIAARLVKEGKTTWLKLEKTKKCFPSKTNNIRSNKTNWFLSK